MIREFSSIQALSLRSYHEKCACFLNTLRFATGARRVRAAAQQAVTWERAAATVQVQLETQRAQAAVIALQAGEVRLVHVTELSSVMRIPYHMLSHH